MNARLIFVCGLLVLALVRCATPATTGAGATLAPTVAPLAPTVAAPTAAPTSTSAPAYPLPTTPVPALTPVATFPQPTPILMQPQSQRAEPGKAYTFSLYTHCGIDFATDFDGSFWDAASPRPAQIGNPFQNGTMTLLDATHSRFTYEKGTIEFTRHVGAKYIPYLCM